MKRDKNTDPLPSELARQPLPPELCQHLGFMLAKAHQEIFARFSRITGPVGLTPRHFGICMLLSSRGAMRQTDMADALRLDRTTLMNFVDELEDAGFAKRGADPDDRRANAVKLTAKGTTWLERVRPAAEDLERHFLQPLTAKEQDVMRELLVRLVSQSGEPA